MKRVIEMLTPAAELDLREKAAMIAATAVSGQDGADLTPLKGRLASAAEWAERYLRTGETR